MGTHHILKDGTSYAIKGGTDLIAGTSYQIGGGRTLVDGTEYEIGFEPDVYTMTLIGSGGTIEYNGIERTETFEVLPGDSISITVSSYNSSNSSHAVAVSPINLNGKRVAESTTFKNGNATGPTTYDYTPSGNATISRSYNSERGYYREEVNITEE